MGKRRPHQPGVIPDKSYFKIGEVASIVAVPPSALRFWEAQFPGYVRPEKSRTGQRLYRRRDVENLLRIRALLHEQRFTIAGAKRQLRSTGMAALAAAGGADLGLAEIDPSGVEPRAVARARAEARALLLLVGEDEE